MADNTQAEDFHATPFAILPEWLLDDDSVSSDAIRLYAILARHANKNRVAWPGQTALAERLKCTDRHIRKLLSQLKDAGALQTVKRRYNGTTIHRIVFDPPERLFLPDDERPERAFLTDRNSGSSLSGTVVPPNESHELEPLNESHRDATLEVFEQWQISTGKRRTVLDAKRRRYITQALRTHGLEDVLAAVRGWEKSPFHRGENDQGTVYNDLGLLLRDGEHIEMFRDYEWGMKEKTRGKPGRVAENFRRLRAVSEGME